MPAASTVDPLAVAMHARLFRLLASRPELRHPDSVRRAESACDDQPPGHLCLLDRVLVVRASELDQLCGYAVALLNRSAPAAVLDLLGVLSPERMLGIYFALPAERRDCVRRDGPWAYHVARADADAVAEAQAWWDDLPALHASNDLSPEAQEAMRRFIRRMHLGEAERLKVNSPKEEAA